MSRERRFSLNDATHSLACPQKNLTAALMSCDYAEDVVPEACFLIKPHAEKFKRLRRMKYSCSDVEKIMPKIIDDNWVRESTISAIFSSIVGSLLVLIYLSWGNSSTSVPGLIVTYLFIVMTSIIGTTMGSLIIGMPLAMIAKRFAPDASLKGSFFIVFSTLFMWLVVLAWPVTRIFETPYSDVLLLSPYAFCSAAALTYLVYWN
ncbi:hypothetical protein [Erwinia rhapontici]|uniref:hypothetical protein n=1 Tax=Erwinia rhapontici TaxID=55212 RepID=UPI003BA1563A